MQSTRGRYQIVVLDDTREIFVNERMIEGLSHGNRLEPGQRVEVLLADDPDLPNDRAAYARTFNRESIARGLQVRDILIAGLVRRIQESI